MSRIRMYVYIRNESDAILTFSRDEILSGEYTPDWGPPAVINPGERKGLQGEGDLVVFPTSGTEGKVWYNIVGDGGGELYIHWNSPLIESPYNNTFHIWAPPGWEVTHEGGQGHHATLEIRLRRTAKRSVPNFDPSINGFAFGNSWSGSLPVISVGFLWNRLFDSAPGPLGDLGIDRVVDENWLPITQADAGMCGGMVYTVMDYFHHQLLPPTIQSSPSSAGDPLFQYIRDRLWDSFDVGGQGHRFLGYSSPHYPNGDEGVIQVLGLSRGRSWVTYREAFPQIQADIDAGRLSPVGLIRTDNLDIGKNHTVLAYAYEKSGQDATLYLYDPNASQIEVKLTFNITQTDGEVHINRFENNVLKNESRIFCFFRIDGYAPRMPLAGRNPADILRQQHIFYQGADNAIHHIFWDQPTNQLYYDSWTARTNAPAAVGNPATMIYGLQQHIFYQGGDGGIHHIFWDQPTNQLYYDSWTARTNAPAAAGDPVTMVYGSQQHIFYRGVDGGIHHIFWDQPTNQLYYDSWTARTNAPAAAGDPATMVYGTQQHIFYRGHEGAMHHIFWDQSTNQVYYDNWTARTNALAAAGDPATMVYGTQQHIFYRGIDGAMYHLFWDQSANQVFYDSWTARTGAPAVAGDPATMVYGAQQHIFYRGIDNAMHHIFWDQPTNQLYYDSWTIRTGAPAAAGDPATLVYDSQQHIFYRDEPGQINHIFWDQPTNQLYYDSWTGITGARAASGNSIGTMVTK